MVYDYASQRCSICGRNRPIMGHSSNVCGRSFPDFSAMKRCKVHCADRSIVRLQPWNGQVIRGALPESTRSMVPRCRKALVPVAAEIAIDRDVGIGLAGGRRFAAEHGGRGVGAPCKQVLHRGFGPPGDDVDVASSIVFALAFPHASAAQDEKPVQSSHDHAQP